MELSDIVGLLGRTVLHTLSSIVDPNTNGHYHELEVHSVRAKFCENIGSYQEQTWNEYLFQGRSADFQPVGDPCLTVHQSVLFVDTRTEAIQLDMNARAQMNGSRPNAYFVVTTEKIAPGCYKTLYQPVNLKM